VTLPAGVTLRTAVLADAEAGARLHRDCWRESYGPITDLTALEEHLADEAGWTARWATQIEAGFAPLLAVEPEDVPVGFARSGDSRDDDVPDTVELYALYVRTAWHGSGIGAALFDRVIGTAPAVLWVLEDNARARAFYRRQGFEPDGARERYEPLSAWEIRMVRR
jgi:GNAT superfamily N-acetyltransferase